VLCFGILHRVRNPIGLLRALADVLAPGGEIVLESYGWRRAVDARAIEVHKPGEVYARDDFVYWGFSPEGLRRLARIAGLDELEVVDQLEIDGHPRILALLRAAGGLRPAIPPCARRSRCRRRRRRADTPALVDVMLL
jgi:tRNA (mo5U34)-methyltransferase